LAKNLRLCAETVEQHSKTIYLTGKIPPMRRAVGLILFSFLFNSLQIQAQETVGVQIKFVLDAPDLADTSSVFITGSVDQLGRWNPSKIKMESKGNHVWTKEITVTNVKSIEYKYTLGSWQREGAAATGAPLPNFNVSVSESKTVNDKILFWTNQTAQRTIEGKITGQVKYHRRLKGEGINDRDIIVWLPPDYDGNKQVRYPVLYMQDGQNIVDPATSAFGVDWKIDESLDSLIKNKIIEPIIVVGIYNSSNRMKEYTPGEKGNAYMNFVVNKVKPLIDSAYLTKSDRTHTMVGGSSAGGIFSFMLVWEHPDIFSKAICMSPAFRLPEGMTGDWNYVTTVRESKAKPKDLFFYIDNGGVGLESELQPGIDEMIPVLKSKGYKEGVNFIFIQDKNARHFESEWAKRFPQAIKWLTSAK